jgi:hypothetical protein
VSQWHSSVGQQQQFRAIALGQRPYLDASHPFGNHHLREIDNYRRKSADNSSSSSSLGNGAAGTPLATFKTPHTPPSTGECWLIAFTDQVVATGAKENNRKLRTRGGVRSREVLNLGRCALEMSPIFEKRSAHQKRVCCFVVCLKIASSLSTYSFLAAAMPACDVHRAQCVIHSAEFCIIGA